MNFFIFFFFFFLPKPPHSVSLLRTPFLEGEDLPDLCSTVLPRHSPNPAEVRFRIRFILLPSTGFGMGSVFNIHFHPLQIPDRKKRKNTVLTQVTFQQVTEYMQNSHLSHLDLCMLTNLLRN